MTPATLAKWEEALEKGVPPEKMEGIWDDVIDKSAVNPCNRAYRLDQALQAVGHFAGMSTSPIGAAALGAQLRANKPVGARIQCSGGGGHFLAFAGLLLGSQPYIGVADPLYGSSDVALSALGGSYQGLGTWNASYLVR